MFIPIRGGNFDITISIGCAILRKGEFKDTRTPEEIAELLIKKADTGMYADKNANGIERGK